MKKIIVIVLLLSVWAITVHGSWWNKETEPPEPKTEIEAGQIWRKKFTGNTHKVLEVGEKYVVYQWAEGTCFLPDAKVREKFLEEFVLVAEPVGIELTIVAETSVQQNKLNLSDTSAPIVKIDLTKTSAWEEEISNGLIFITTEDPNDPAICKHSELIAKDKKGWWVFRATSSETGSLFHRVYLCQTCKSEITIGVATRIFKEKK